MVNNQFGMVGLLTFIRAAESDPNLVTLAMGQDLTGLGLNLNSQENLYPTFGGPFSDQPCRYVSTFHPFTNICIDVFFPLFHTHRPQDIDFHVPPEYLVNMSIRDKLANLTLKKYKDDLLFFLFYGNVGDYMQLAAAAELYVSLFNFLCVPNPSSRCANNLLFFFVFFCSSSTHSHSRDWRYHIEEKVWITRAHGIAHYEKNGNTERGTFYYFDAQNWRRVPKDFQIVSSKLDKCPNLSAIVGLTGQPV